MRTRDEFQSEAVDAVVELILAGRNPLLVSPTGSGKTRMGSMIVERLQRPTIWTAHRAELVEQAQNALRGFGVNAALQMSGRPFYANRPVHVGSIGTAANKPIAGKTLAVIDEAHHSAAGTYRKFQRMYFGVPLLGLTATPFRLDGQGLGDVFTDLVIAAYPDELVAAGHLVEPKVYAPPAVDLAGIRVTRGGDYNDEQLAARFDKPKLVGDVVQTWQTHAAGYRTIVFACNVPHSKHLAEAFRAVGVAAEHIDGDTDSAERRRILDRFRSGETTLLCNVELFTEGFDLPSVECVVLDRATASLCLFLQMVGRAMRLHAGKRHPVVLDHAGNFLRHGRVTRRIEYSLTGRPKFAQSGGTGIHTCPGCFRISDHRRSKCPACGLVFATLAEPVQVPDHEDGALRMYTAEQLDAATASPETVAAAEADASRKEKDQTWWSLIAIAKKRGLSSGWVSKQYQLKTGEIRTVREVAWNAPDVAAAQQGIFAEFGRAIA